MLRMGGRASVVYYGDTRRLQHMLTHNKKEDSTFDIKGKIVLSLNDLSIMP
jgi:hypothetical protein